MREPQGVSELLRRRVRLVARVGSVGLVCGLDGLIEPHPGVGPMTADGFLGDLQDLGRFGVGQANEIVQLDDFGANRILQGQLLQGFILVSAARPQKHHNQTRQRRCKRRNQQVGRRPGCDMTQIAGYASPWRIPTARRLAGLLTAQLAVVCG